MPIIHLTVNPPGPPKDADEEYAYEFDERSRRLVRDQLALGSDSMLFIFDDGAHEDNTQCLSAPYIGRAQECNGGYWYVTFGSDDWWDVFDEGLPNVVTGTEETIDYIVDHLERLVADPIETEYQALAKNGKDVETILAELRTKDVRLTIDASCSRFFRDVISGQPLDWHVFVDPNCIVNTNRTASAPLSYNRLAQHIEPCETQ